MKVNDSMFMFQAPDWVDGERCHTCRVEFGVVQRKVRKKS